MGPLFVGVLAGILIGFGLFGPSQGYFLDCGSTPCFDGVAVNQPADPKPAASGPDPPIVKSAANSAKTKSAQRSAKKPHRVAVAKAMPSRTAVSVTAPDRAAEASDAVLNKAKLSIAAKMEDPGSAQFSDMDRAIRLNTFGRAVDTICGHVRGKNASGGDTGERPFLYLVKEDDAYVVMDGKPDSAAAIAHRNICK
jgi:hypothetical protein